MKKEVKVVTMRKALIIAGFAGVLVGGALVFALSGSSTSSALSAQQQQEKAWFSAPPPATGEVYGQFADPQKQK